MRKKEMGVGPFDKKPSRAGWAGSFRQDKERKGAGLNVGAGYQKKNLSWGIYFDPVRERGGDKRWTWTGGGMGEDRGNREPKVYFNGHMSKKKRDKG